jgi:phosphoribosylaminoimidazole-succinocarboxamide synthase
MLIDEVHTPDSSRFWTEAGFAQAQATGTEPEPWDKEFLRLWYVEQGYRGDGEPPKLSEKVIVETARRYIALFEGLTGQPLQPAPYPAAARIKQVLETFQSRVAYATGLNRFS